MIGQKSALKPGALFISWGMRGGFATEQAKIA